MILKQYNVTVQRSKAVPFINKMTNVPILLISNLKWMKKLVKDNCQTNKCIKCFSSWRTWNI